MRGAEFPKDLPTRERARKALILSGDAAGIPDFLTRWHGSHERPHAFLELAADMRCDGASFWRVVALEWDGFDAIPHRAYARAFRQHRAAWSPDCMTPENRAAWDALPTTVTLYRGQPGIVPAGLAWTADRAVAARFARGHRGIIVPYPVVLRATVKKSAIAFACTERCEAEAVLFRAPTNYTREDVGQ